MEDTSRQTVSYKGTRYWVNGGYWMSRQGKLLHLAVYRDHYGPIPAGHDIHHKDENKLNWHPDNLEALTRSEHLKLHRPKGWRPGLEKECQDRSWRMWKSREKRDVTCINCGKVYQSNGMRVKYCHPNCAMQHRYKLGKVKKKKYVPKKRERYRNPPAICVICNKEFRREGRQTPTCSRKCGMLLRSQRYWASKSGSSL